MPHYIRNKTTGGTYFFTLCLNQRHNNSLLTDHINLLRNAARYTKHRQPFIIHAWVVLPEHLHCIIELPQGDTNYALRWRLIKAHFSRHLPKGESTSTSRTKRGERGIWQRRFWEHLIRDDDDYQRHVDYIHFNPVKHGHVTCAQDWPYSTFHRAVKQGLYEGNWVNYDAFDIEHD